MSWLDGLVSPIYWSMTVTSQEDTYKIVARTKPLSNKLVSNIEEQFKLNVAAIPVGTIFKVETGWWSKEQLKTIDLLLFRKIKPGFSFLTRDLKELNIYRSDKGVQLGVVFEGIKKI
jgi:hypothetical protein